MKAVDMVEDGLKRIDAALKVGRFSKDDLVKIKQIADKLSEATQKLISKAS